MKRKFKQLFSLFIVLTMMLGNFSPVLLYAEEGNEDLSEEKFSAFDLNVEVINSMEDSEADIEIWLNGDELPKTKVDGFVKFEIVSKGTYTLSVLGLDDIIFIVNADGTISSENDQFIYDETTGNYTLTVTLPETEVIIESETTEPKSEPETTEPETTEPETTEPKFEPEQEETTEPETTEPKSEPKPEETTGPELIIAPKEEKSTTNDFGLMSNGTTPPPYEWTITTDKKTYEFGETIKFDLDLIIRDLSEDIWDELIEDEFFIYLKPNVFNHLDVADFDIEEYEGVPIFSVEVVDSDIIGAYTGYIKFKIKLNPNVKQKLEDNEVSLSTANMNFSLTLNNNITEELIEEPVVYITDGDEILWGEEIDINIPEIDPPKVKEPTITKSPSTVYTKKGDKRSSTSVVEVGDFVIYKITIKNNDETPKGNWNALDPREITKIIETIPSGYTYISDIANTALYGKLTTTDILNKYNKWTSPDRTTYSYTDVPITLASQETFVTYIILEVKDPADDEFENVEYSLGNNVTFFHDKSDESGTGTGHTLPNPIKEYDLALTTWIVENRKNTQDGEHISYITPLNSARPVEIEKDTDIDVEFTVINQGVDALIKSIYAYVPKGYTFVQSRNSGWTPVIVDSSHLTYPKDVDGTTGIWSDLTVYEYKFNPDNNLGKLIERGNNTATVKLRLTVSHVTSESGYDAEDFYIAGEICEFTNLIGDKVKDIDSIPVKPVDSDEWKGPDYNLYLPGEGYTSISSGDKEISGKIDGNSRTGENGWDSDDFDFDYCIPVSKGTSVDPPEGTEEESDYLSKKLVETSGRLDGFSTGLKNSLSSWKTSEDGEVQSKDNHYLVYEIWVNKLGILDTNPSTFIDTLPKGLQIYKYDGSHAIRVDKIVPISDDHYTSLKIGDVTHQIIDYSAPPPYTYTVNNLKFYKIDEDDINNINAISNQPPTHGADFNAARFGVTGTVEDVVGGGQIITINFGEPNPPDGLTDESEYKYEQTHAAYKITMVVEFNEDFKKNNPVQNYAEYNAFEKSVDVTQEEEVLWTSGSGAAFVKKDIIPANAEDISAEEFDKITYATVDENGKLTVKYRFRVSTIGKNEINANKIEIWDILSDNTTNYKFENFELVGTLDSRFIITGNPTVSNPTLVIKNTSSINKDQIIDIVFKVTYNSIKNGHRIENVALGRKVHTLTPLTLQVKKYDSEYKDPLKLLSDRYEFGLYYDDAGINQLKDVNGNDIIITSIDDTVTFWPDDIIYINQETGKQEIKSPPENGIDFYLIENNTPEGYSDNQGRIFKLNVNWDEDGNFFFVKNNLESWLNDTKDENEDIYYEFTGNNVSFDLLNVYNDRDKGSISITKTLEGNTESNTDFEIILKDSNGNAIEANAKIDNNDVVFDPDGYFKLKAGETVTFTELELGTYTITEKTSNKYKVRYIYTRTPVDNGDSDIQNINTVIITEENHNEKMEVEVINIEPIELSLLKYDINKSRTESLTGYTIKAYYEIDGERVTVKDINGNPVVFTDENVVYHIWPDGYEVAGTDKVDIILVETATPEGYSQNLNREYVINILWDNGIFKTVSSENGYIKIDEPADDSDTYTINAYNDLDEGEISITKTLHGETDGEKEFLIRLLYVNADNEPIKENAKIGDTNVLFDNEGYFTLKADETIKFTKLWIGEYIVEEKIPDSEDYLVRYVRTINDESTSVEDNENTVEITAFGEINYQADISFAVVNIEPLKLALRKYDIAIPESDLSLSDYEIRAYYFNGTPLLDINGNSVVFTDEEEIYNIRPDGYSVIGTGNVEIILIETIYPAGYSQNLNREYRITISWIDGIFTIENITTEDDYIQFVPLNEESDIIIINAYNDRDEGTLTVMKRASYLSGSFEIRVYDVANDEYIYPDESYTKSINGYFYLPINRTATFTELPTGEYIVEERTYRNQSYTVRMTSSEGIAINGSIITVELTKDNYETGINVVVNNTGPRPPVIPPIDPPVTPPVDPPPVEPPVTPPTTPPTTPKPPTTPDVPTPPTPPSEIITQPEKPNKPIYTPETWEPLYDLFGPNGPKGLFQADTSENQPIPKVTQTSDNAKFIGYALVLISGIGIMAVYVIKNKRKFRLIRIRATR